MISAMHNFRPANFVLFPVYLLLATTITGCVLHPVAVDNLPYTENQVEFLKPGITSRKEVEAEIGKPDIVRDNNTLSLYGDARTVAGAFFGFDGSSHPVESHHLLVIHYDSDDFVNSAEVLRLPALLGDPYAVSDKEICTTDEICINPRFIPTGRSFWFDFTESVLQRAVVFDRPDEDADIKTFKIHQQKCTLFIYQNEKTFMINREVEVHRVSPYAETVSINENGYIYWTTEPGPIILSAGVLPRLNVRTSPPVDGNLENFIFDCQAGKQYFINIDLSESWTKYILKISLEDTETGKASVLKRRLMIDI